MIINLKEQINFDSQAELTEAKDVVTTREKALKLKLIALLKKNGHPRYAERLEDFIVHIVRHGDEPATAAISFDEGIIYINQDMIVDPKKDPTIFNQLDVIVRHELLHNLLMHQVRMMKHITAIPGSRIRMSQSIHKVLNIIEDFEISNKAYTDADKEVVRNTWLNGRLISGLVTEDHRETWGGPKAVGKHGMSVEEMYDALMQEIEDMGNTGELADTNSDTISAAVAGMHSFKDVTSPAEFTSPEELEDAIMAGVRRNDPNAKLPPEWQEVFDGLKQIQDDPVNGYSPQDIVNMLQELSKAKAIGAHDIVSPKTGAVLVTVYTPEEKAVANEYLKSIIAYPLDYKTWYDEIMQVVGSDTTLTDDDIQALLDALA